MSTVVEFERPGAPPAAAVEDFIAASGARPSDQIVIAGAVHLETLISLTRRGFSRAICQSPQCCPHVPGDKADAIFAPVVANEAALLSILQGLGSTLRPGGALVVETAAPLDLARDARARAAVAASGFAALEPAGPALWRARKQTARLTRAA